MITKAIREQKTKIPKPAISRLCRIYNLLEELKDKGETSISSKDIGIRLGVGSHNIRKDISYIGEPGTSGSGYEISRLKAHIDDVLGIKKFRNACIIGLGGLGLVIMNYQKPLLPSFNIIAGFDSNINKLETIKISIPVYPTYEITEVIKKENIELAVITESDRNIEKISERLFLGGIKGIINFTPMIIGPGSDKVTIRNIDIISEFRYLAALFTLADENKI
jgi:redox-sensing transcriptional repressor